MLINSFSILGGVTLGAVLGHQLSLKASREQRAAEVLSRYDDRVAEAIGTLQSVLADLNPDVMAFNFDPDRPLETFGAALQELKENRRELGTISAGHPDREVHVLLGEVLRRRHVYLAELRNVLHLLATHSDGLLDARATAVQAYESVLAAIDTLTDRLHDRGRL